MPASEQGIFPDQYTLVPRALIFAMREGSILLIKGASTKRVWPNLYNGVGGHIEPGESVLDGAKREFLEETGLELVNPWLAAVITIDTGRVPGIGMYVFRGEAAAGKIIPSSEGQLEWVPKTMLSELILVEDLPVLLPRVLQLQHGGEPLFAHYSYDNNENLIVRFSSI